MNPLIIHATTDESRTNTGNKPISDARIHAELRRLWMEGTPISSTSARDEYLELWRAAA